MCKCKSCGDQVQVPENTKNTVCASCLIEAANNSSQISDMFMRVREQLLDNFAPMMPHVHRNELIFSIRYGEENEQGGLRLQASITAPEESVPGMVWPVRN